MVQVTLEQAEGHLAELIEQVQAGEEIVITESGAPLARLSRLDGSESHSGKYKPRIPGLLSNAGFYMAEDFDAPLEEFAEYM